VGRATRSGHYQDHAGLDSRQYRHEKNLTFILSRVVHSRSMSNPDVGSGSWTLLTGHGHMLVEIARNPEGRIRDISQFR
jgi:hypothetical protein